MFDRKLVACCLPLDLNLFSGRHWYTIKRDSGKFDDFFDKQKHQPKLTIIVGAPFPITSSHRRS